MGLDITNRLVDLTHVKALIQVQLEFTHLELTVVPELFQLLLAGVHTGVVLFNFVAVLLFGEHFRVRDGHNLRTKLRLKPKAFCLETLTIRLLHSLGLRI